MIMKMNGDPNSMINGTIRYPGTVWQVMLNSRLSTPYLRNPGCPLYSGISVLTAEGSETPPVQGAHEARDDPELHGTSTNHSLN